MAFNKLGIATAAVAAAALIGGGASVAVAAGNTAAPTTAPAASAPAVAGQQGGEGMVSQDTPITGDQATKITAAVTAQNAGVTITEVRQDPDGTYDALGTKADGSVVFYDVSADLATIRASRRPARRVATENPRCPGGRPGCHNKQAWRAPPG